MRIPSHRQRRSLLDNDSMTPMIDVVFLLLVFFVCASIGQTPESLLPADLATGTTESEVVLPDTEPQEWPSPPVRIRLALHPDSGQLLIELNEGAVANAAQLMTRLKTLAELDAGAPITLDIDDNVSIQQFIGIYDLCQVLAFESISFAVRNPTSL